MLRTILSVLSILLLVTNCWALQTVSNVQIRPGEPYVAIVNPEYPKKPLNPNSFFQWNLAVESDSKIRIVCDDIRMGQPGPWTPECEHVYISFDDGRGERKLCGPQKSGFQYRSKGPQVTVRMVSKSGGGFLQCTAYNTKEPEPTIIHLEPTGRIRYAGSPKEPIPNFDKVWILNSPPGTRISLQCRTALADRSPCYKDILTIDNGEGAKEYCGGKEFNLFSKNNYVKIRLQLNEVGDTSARCLVQAVTGPHVNQFMNVPNEVIESSEHGVVSGPRKTTCKCGWANRNPARIIFGVETNENEYPWMVLLNTYHTMSNGMRIMFYCGGSIITKKHVLTAAHCVVNKYTNKVALPGDVTVILAEHDSSKDSGKEKSYEVETVFVHENYLLQQSHDIALLHLKNDIEFNDIIGPVCLYPDELPVVNRHIKIMGWGRTEGGQGSNVLLKSYSTVIDNQLCEGASSFEICTFIKPGSTCSGDSGGPLVWLDPETNRYAQVSLVSRGHPDCQSSPTISTQISSFYNWIVERIKLTDPSAETCQKI